MYIAELKGKLSLADERKEDILTSNVFSFFKYSTRKVFLKEYLRRLQFSVSDEEAEAAEFEFWPRYEENTEPDLVLLVGKYYLLFEAKYFSNFGQETKTTRGQLIREIEGGLLDAKNYGKEFKLVAITADHYYRHHRFDAVPKELHQHLKWTNWQIVSHLLYDALERGWDLRQEDVDFARDLYNLLDRKNLRNFLGTHIPHRRIFHRAQKGSVFFEANTARYRGNFIGFLSSFSESGRLRAAYDAIFYEPRRMFFAMNDAGLLHRPQETIFWKEKG
ncbi:MAG TPA: hypothetical protein VGJ94_19005 [Syntrophorhabdaceae bacterium]|jgi:hypothetical protein